MYLSRLILNPRNAQARNELAHPYEMHRTLLQAFSNGIFKVARNNVDAAGILFRAEERQNDNAIVVLVQSKIKPDWTYLIGKKDSRSYLYMLPKSFMNDGKLNPAVSEFELSEKIRQGQTLSFRLRANPTKRRKDNGKRVGIYKEEEQIAWLIRKADESGFHLLRHQISHDGKIKDSIHRNHNEHDRIELLSVQFDGLLKVREPERLLAAVQAGIGSGKGLGFGLLSLAPA